MLISKRIGAMVEDAIERSGEDREETSGEFDSDAYPGDDEVGSDFFFSFALWVFAICKKVKED